MVGGSQTIKRKEWKRRSAKNREVGNTGGRLAVSGAPKGRRRTTSRSSM